MTCGWFSVSNGVVGAMKIKNMTGYMLGNDHRKYKIGDAWANHDSRVWVCPSADKAKQILQKSQANTLEPCCVWTTIYRVSARDIVCEKSSGGLWYTCTPTKICVERVVYAQNAHNIAETQLIQNAKQQYGRFARFMLSLDKEDER